MEIELEPQFSLIHSYNFSMNPTLEIERIWTKIAYLVSWCRISRYYPTEASMARRWTPGIRWKRLSTVLLKSCWLHPLLPQCVLIDFFFSYLSYIIRMSLSILHANLFQIMGVIVGATPWLKSLFAGSSAPLRVVEDTVKLLGWFIFCCLLLVEQIINMCGGH